MPMWHKYSLPLVIVLISLFSRFTRYDQAFFLLQRREKRAFEHRLSTQVSGGFLSLEMKRYHLLLFRALQKNCIGALEPNPFVLFLGRFNFRQKPKISSSPETHEYLDQRITYAEINLRQNKILQNIKYILMTNKYNVQSLVL